MRKSFSLQDIAKMLALQKNAVLRLVHSGELRAFNVGRGDRPTWRVREEDLDAFIDRRANAPPLVQPPKRKSQKPVKERY